MFVASIYFGIGCCIWCRLKDVVFEDAQSFGLRRVAGCVQLGWGGVIVINLGTQGFVGCDVILLHDDVQ